MESSASLLKQTPKAPSPMRGFTMVEMLVSLGIILIITSIVLLGQDRFNKNLVLVDTAYTVAFTLRQAQTFALSSRKFQTTQNAGYGVHFTKGSFTSYTLFADTVPSAPGNGQGGLCPGHVAQTGLESRPGNCEYNGSAELVTTYNLNHGFKVSGFCGFPKVGLQQCIIGDLDELHISFLRPNTQAVMLGERAGSLVELTSAKIYITSPDGENRCVNVSKVGQIAVGNC